MTHTRQQGKGVTIGIDLAQRGAVAIYEQPQRKKEMAVSVAVDQKQRDMEKQLLAQLGELGGSGFTDDDVLVKGKQLILPEGMSLLQGEKFLRRKREEAEQTTEFSRPFKYRPMDGAYCTWNALRKAFGAVGHTGTTVQSLFGPFKINPELRSINVAPDRVEQVPWGAFTLPFLPGVEVTLDSYDDDEFGPLFFVRLTGPKKFKNQIEGIFKLIQIELEENSMYKGQPIDGKPVPEFLDLSGVDPSKVIYTEEVKTQIEANIYSPIQYANATRSHGLPLKRSVLIYGPYGTGKTLAAFLTAKKAVEHGWTFLYAKPGRDDLAFVMQTARLYQPAVVFYEDMDLVASADEDNDQMTMMLDAFDGITAKGTEIMVILTTNHPEKIHKGMVRPGRLDAVIHIDALDERGIQDMIEALIPGHMLAGDIDYSAVGVAMEGYLPAFVKEATDRTLRYAITRSGGETENVVLDTADFVGAAQGLRNQLELMEDAKDQQTKDPLTEQFHGIANNAAIKAVRETVNPDLLVRD